MLARKLAVGSLACLLLLANSAFAGPDPLKAAARIDESLAKEIPSGGQTPMSDDATFLRRLSLSLVGQIPTPAETTAFALDTSPNKRTAAAERLIADNRFGVNWARYWRDVILYRRSDDRALLVGPTLVSYLSDRFNKDSKWDQLAKEFITATGDIRESGDTAIIIAQMADPANTTAEISRIFMGVQIQCAQCHHHPTDRWKREQFHELAAFFPRVGVRPVKTGEKRSFKVVSMDVPRGKRAPGATEPATLEYFMPDLDDPAAPGKRMTPTFFATGQKAPLGLNDKERRLKIAEWITSRGDGWFAKAYVNRMWGELVGQGFYEPLDDLGPDRKPTAPHTLNMLSADFVASGYDVKWLFRAITATDAFQRLGQRRQQEDHANFAANCAQRLRADQLFNALAVTLEIDENDMPRRAKRNPRAALNSPRGQMNRVFGFDPSERRDEQTGSIPQALFMMNSPELNRAVNSQRSDSILAILLGGAKDDESVLVELYLRCLGREPKESELKICTEHVGSSGNRAKGMEDILWASVNSTEFLYRK